jgi:lysyl-tRNA synthetase, class II
VRLRAESVVAGAAAAVGLTGIASALTPELANRVDVVRAALPPGAPAAARIATLSFGLALVWLSRSLARRRRRAWQLAVALVVGIALGHLAKGLDVEEAASALILLAALVRYRRRFEVPGDPHALRPLLATALALAATGGLTVWLELDAGPDRVEDMLAAASLVAAFRALYLWLRPLSARVRQTVDEQRTAQQLVGTYGRDSLSFFTLRRDKNYLFSPERRAFLAYRVVAGTLLVSGDPVGDEDELDSLLAEVCRLSRASGWRLGVVGASAAALERYRRLGLRPIKLGDEAVLRPDRFTLEGRPIRKVRQSVARLDRAGYRFRATTPTEADPRLRAQLDEVSQLWRGAQPDRGFSMAHDDLYAADTLVAVAEDARGRIGGFLHLVPTPASGGYSLSAMRRRPGTPNGLMEFLIVRTLEWARAGGVPELSLNFCAFTDLLQPSARLWRRVTRRALLCLDRLFQLERLYSFNRKFFPEWRPRYLCVERLADLPLVGLAYLHAESLLIPPGPWASRAGRHSISLDRRRERLF